MSARHTLRLAYNDLNKPRPIGLWAWSWVEDDVDEYRGAFHTRQEAVDAADADHAETVADRSGEYDVGETVAREVHLVRFCWQSRDKTERLLINRDKDEVECVVEARFDPIKEYGSKGSM